MEVELKSRAREFETEALVYLDTVYDAAMRLTQNRVEAEDLTQDTFVRAYRFFEKYERGTNCRAWLLKIMTNLFINRFNKIKSGPEISRFDDDLRYLCDDAPVNTSYIENADFDIDEVFNGLVDDDITRLLAQLPEDFRISIVLCDIQGFSYADVAEATNVSIGTVKSRLFRARRRLRKGLWQWAGANGYALKGSVNETT